MAKPKYPGLKKDEIEVMDRFLAGKYLEGEYTYDVKLYLKCYLDLSCVFPLVDHRSINENYTEIKTQLDKVSEVKGSIVDVTASRIDCIVETDSQIWLLEVTPKLKKHVIGGCLLYRDLFMYQFEPTKPVRLGIVSGVDDPRTHFTLKKHDIKLWIV